jgi:hypothetical protein
MVMRALVSLLLAGLAAYGASACDAILGIDEHELAAAADGGGVPLGDGATPRADGGVDAAMASHDAAFDVTADDAPDGGCMTGDHRCNGNTPQQCVGGVWQNETPCSGATLVCSGGVCGIYRSTGGIRSTAPSPATGAGIHLASGGFELGVRSCEEAGVCVTGGIVP